MKNDGVLDIDFMLKHLKLAGFTIRNVDRERKYISAEHPHTNSYSQLFQISNNKSLETQSDFLKVLFGECKKVGRIQVRQELSKAIGIFNYD